jgi:hypothetical protein
MSLSLRCPNCGATIGEMDRNNNYEYKFYYKGENGQPKCNNCGTGDRGKSERNISLFILIVTLLIILFL